MGVDVIGLLVLGFKNFFGIVMKNLSFAVCGIILNVGVEVFSDVIAMKGILKHYASSFNWE